MNRRPFLHKANTFLNFNTSLFTVSWFRALSSFRILWVFLTIELNYINFVEFWFFMLVYTIPFIVFASGNESASFIKFSTNCTCHSANAILQPWISCRPGRYKYTFYFFRFIRFTFFIICNFDFTFFWIR